MTDKAWARFKKLREQANETPIASYFYVDLPQGNRLHQWGQNNDAIFAIGQGPIRYIDRKDSELYLAGIMT